MGRQKRAYQSVTIRDVAERAGVAVSTVSRVLNGLDRVSEETRRRVEQAARELSYVPNNFAASMVTGQSKILGIIVPSFTHDFFGFIAQTAEHVFRKHGYLTIVSASGEDPVADPAAFLQRFYHMLDGVLLVPTAARLKDLESFDKPLLLVDRDMPGSSFSSISFDNEPACYELTRRLTEKGHRRIGLLVLNSPMNIGADRLAGCLRALREAGVEQDPALVRCCAAAAVDGYTQTRLMMTMPDPPTAIVCCSEELCTGAVRACMDLSLVPGISCRSAERGKRLHGEPVFPSEKTAGTGKRAVSGLRRLCTQILSICIFLVIYGRMIEVYCASRSAACNPQAVRGHFGNPALASR